MGFGINTAKPAIRNYLQTITITMLYHMHKLYKPGVLHLSGGICLGLCATMYALLSSNTCCLQDYFSTWKIYMLFCEDETAPT